MQNMEMKIPIEVSARHIHLSQKDLEKLFGKGYKLKKLRQLNQPGDFCAEESLELGAGDKKIKGVRIVGPAREQTQVEISLTDAVFLGVTPPVRLSGDLEGSAAFTLIGPAGAIKLSEGLIIAQRHIHCGIGEAENFGLENNSLVSVKIEGERAATFHNVKVRVKDDYKICMHIDTDEGNAAGINKIGKGTIIL